MRMVSKAGSEDQRVSYPGIEELPIDFFTCRHGYHHYKDCPLCGRFPSQMVDDLEYAFEGFEITMQDKKEIVDFLTNYTYL